MTDRKSAKVKKKESAYEVARNKLIPEAEEYANKTAGTQPKKKHDREKWGDAWNLAFHTKMNTLAREEGLTDQAQ